MKTLILTLLAVALAAPMMGCADDPVTSPSATSPLSKTVLRPLSDFLDAQGTYCIDDGGGGCFTWWPDVDNYLGWSNMTTGRFALVDYAGIADRWITEASDGATTFGTTFRGTVKETQLKDGTVEVSVDLHTTNALAFATEVNNDGFGAMLFGAQAPQVLAGATPALVDCHLKVDFVLPEKGAPIPDIVAWLMDDAPGANITRISFEASGPGELHAAFGVPEGTPGRLHITQVGHLASRSQSKNFDGFPVENVNLTATR